MLHARAFLQRSHLRCILALRAVSDATAQQVTRASVPCVHIARFSTCPATSRARVSSGSSCHGGSMHTACAERPERLTASRRRCRLWATHDLRAPRCGGRAASARLQTLRRTPSTISGSLAHTPPGGRAPPPAAPADPDVRLSPEHTRPPLPFPANECFPPHPLLAPAPRLLGARGA